MVPYAKRMEKMAFTANVVKGLFGSMTNPDIISFSGGSPAREALPVDTIRQLADEVLRTDTRGVEALQYGPIEGIRDLREVVVRELLAPKGIDCGVDNVIIITGGLEGINLACQAYIDPGDVILVEAPTFVQSVEIFDMFEARCVGVAMDDDGLIPEDLERKIRQCHPKMIYVIPTFQNPSGRTLSLERRKAVAELAAKYDVLVLEDDPYRDIRYSGEDLPPIKHFDTTGHVVMAGSFSKIFSPGSRLGYVVADTETIQHLVDVKSATNSHTSMLPQILCAEFFKRGCYPAHHQMICDLYRRRRDVMLQSIDRYFPAGTKHSNPDGGLFTWVELPGGIDTSALLQESSTDPAVNVAFVAGEGFFSDRDGQGKNCMRMSFGNTPEDLIEDDGKYWMYWGEKFVNVATSTDLINWEPMLDEKGDFLKVITPREGKFDSDLTECGPPAIMTDKGILLLYNGKNKSGAEGDTLYTANSYCAGQALFDAKDPTKLIDRLDKPFYIPESDFEKSGQYPAGTVFIEGLVFHNQKWYLYYGSWSRCR